MPDPVDDLITAFFTYDRSRMPADREQLRKALKRWVKSEIRAHVLDGEGYPG